MSIVHKFKHAVRLFAESITPVSCRLFGDRGHFFFLCGVVGVLCGCGAALMKLLIGLISKAVVGGLPVAHSTWHLLLFPFLGIVLAGIYARYIIKLPLEHGTERLNVALRKKNYYMPSRLVFAPIFGASLTLGFGGSAGSEGPIAYTGAAIGSNLGRAFGLTDQQMRVLIGVGAGCGIAGIFKAPIGGALFTLEVMALEITTFSVIGLLVGCLMAGVTAYLLSGCTMDIPYHAVKAFDPAILPAVVAMGIAVGAYSLWYTFCMTRSEKFLNGFFKNVWVKNIFSGLFLALLLFLFPNLYGEGYDVAGNLMNGRTDTLMDGSIFHAVGPWGIMAVLAATLAVKGFATQTTNSGGGIGGDFAPTLFAGALAGYLFAIFSNQVFGTHLSAPDFAYFGMAGAMAGCIQAPLMALFLTVEMSGDFSMFLPLMIAAAISYGMVRFCSYRWREIFYPVWHHHLNKASE
ncbi:MAG: chloride channel protein [Muribaculaceae bacterium]|nr:chloride channel protein [Muribaculaceae bacterium]MDE7393568.1 chloride channel protein [Muribaculaceae bacterium]